MRMRRDVRSFLAVVKSSAVTHKAQREVDVDGAIVATIDDYRHAYEAFAEELAAVHGKASAKVVAVVEAIEDMLSDNDLGVVKVTFRELAKRLRIASFKTAGERLDEAIDFGAIEQDESMSGRGGARFYRVIMKAEDIRVKPGLGVFPPPDIVRKIILNPTASPRTNEQKEQREQKGQRKRI